MPTVVDALPYSAVEGTLPFQSFAVTVRRYQIVVWVGIGAVGDLRPPVPARPFPAILDTGHNHNFAITPSQLRDWAGIDWRTLPLEPRVQSSYDGVVVPHRKATLWLYPNRPGIRDTIDPTRPPVPLDLNGGLAVYGDRIQVGGITTGLLSGPRLPLLGLRALTTNQVVLRIDSAALVVHLDVP